LSRAARAAIKNAMVRTHRTRRWLAALAATVVVGLGTFGLHHLYADGFDAHDLAHDCLTCKVVSASAALVSAQPASITSMLVVSAPRVPAREPTHAASQTPCSPRAPPLV
jgi:hypothetical protein